MQQCFFHKVQQNGLMVRREKVFYSHKISMTTLVKETKKYIMGIQHENNEYGFFKLKQIC